MRRAAQSIVAGTESDGHLVARLVEEVPEFVGFSLVTTDHRVTFTLVSSDDEVAVLDGVQYLDGGPSQDALAQRHGVKITRADDLDASPWRLFAQAAGARGVRSILTVPVTDGGRLLAVTSLFAASDDAFDGRHEELAPMVDAWAADAVHTTDASLPRRRLAAQVPQSLRAEGLVSRAVGLLEVRSGMDVAGAHERLDDAAARAGIAPHRLAEALVTLGMG